MTLVALRAEPCWEMIDVESGLPPGAEDGEGWPHFATRLEAAEAIARRVVDHWADLARGWLELPLLLRTAQSLDKPCVGIRCDHDGCSELLDWSGEGATHCDPRDPFPIPITDLDWVAVEQKSAPDLHFCPDHHPPWCEDCNERLPIGHECEAI